MLSTVTIAATAANDQMAGLHDRVPVIIEEDDWPAWLGEEAGDFAALLRPAAPGLVRLWAVSRAVNSVRNNGPELLVSSADPEPETLAEAAVNLNPA